MQLHNSRNEIDFHTIWRVAKRRTNLQIESE